MARRPTYTQSDYTDIALSEALTQWDSITRRVAPAPGKRQVPFTPVETLLCLAAMFVVDHSRFGSSSAHRAPAPIQQLAALYKRPPSSILAKMANLDGTRSHGARHDLIAGVTLRSDTTQMTHVYRTVLAAARRAGINPPTLPDFLGLETGGDLIMLGQDDIDSTDIESVVEQKMRDRLEDNLSDLETERMLTTSIRVGQHRFADGVLRNCGRACVFCGFSLTDGLSPTLLRASHIKPWRSAQPKERLDVANGIAACPTHDAAFDIGLLTIDDDLRISRSVRLVNAMSHNAAVAEYFSDAHLHPTLTLPTNARLPDLQYLRWHREEMFANTA